MSHAEDIDRLEQVVEKLLDSYQALKLDYDNVLAAKQQLEDDNNVLQQQFESGEKELKQKLDELQIERSGVRGRVEGLISKIEKWERGMTVADEPVDSVEQEAIEDIPEEQQPQSNMFNASPDQQ